MKTYANKKLFASLMLCIFILATLLPVAQSQLQTKQTFSTRENLHWWNTQWPYRKLITIDHTKVSADLTNFPVLISRASDADLTAAQATGQDIVFIRFADNITQLNHEIEYFNQATGQLTTWVNIPTLSATSDTKLWMYYGNPTCSNQQNIPGTWDINYLMVQHLNETDNTLYDSTSYQNHGLSTGTDYTNTGKIDGGRLYNSNDKIVINNFTHSPTALTVEAWVYRDYTPYIYIACKGTYSETCDWILYLRNNQSADQGIDFSVVNHSAYIRKGDTPVHAWFYLTATYLNGTAILYFNATQLGTAAGWPSIPNNRPHLGLGNDYQGNEGTIYPMTDVKLDELRVSNNARNSSWINTSYKNQKDPVSFYSVGTEQQYEYTLTVTADPSGGGTIAASPGPPYYYNDIVTLLANPNSGYQFDHWSGDLTGTQNPISLAMNANKSVTATFTLESNNPPIAEDDIVTVQENTTNNQFNVLANDHDPDGDTLTIIAVTQPLHGVSSHDGSYTYYTPTTSYSGADSFTYTISDGNGGTDTATVYLTVQPNVTNNPPNQPNHPVPDDQAVNISITTDLGWSGGDPDPDDTVTYTIYFGPTATPPIVSTNQSTTIFNLGTLAYDTTYYWRVIAWDNHGASATGPLWRFTTQDNAVPGEINVTITRPIEHAFYLRNIKLFSFPRLSIPRTTFIYGPITITAKVTTNNTSVDCVEFYIDGKLKKTDDKAPYNYRWSPLRCFKHTITVKAYDIHENEAIDELIVFKWRLHPILLLSAAYILTNHK